MARRQVLDVGEELTRCLLRRVEFRPLLELNQVTDNYLNAHEADPKPFVWIASANTIIANHERGKRLLDSLR